MTHEVAIRMKTHSHLSQINERRRVIKIKNKQNITITAILLFPPVNKIQRLLIKKDHVVQFCPCSPV